MLAALRVITVLKCENADEEQAVNDISGTRPATPSSLRLCTECSLMSVPMNAPAVRRPIGTFYTIVLRINHAKT
jgi:hypothetical protein